MRNQKSRIACLLTHCWDLHALELSPLDMSCFHCVLRWLFTMQVPDSDSVVFTVTDADKWMRPHSGEEYQQQGQVDLSQQFAYVLCKSHMRIQDRLYLVYVWIQDRLYLEYVCPVHTLSFPPRQPICGGWIISVFSQPSQNHKAEN